MFLRELPIYEYLLHVLSAWLNTKNKSNIVFNVYVEYNVVLNRETVRYIDNLKF